MYLRRFLFCVMLLLSITGFAQIGIGTTSPDASSLLDVNSTTQGILTPRMTTTQRLAISDPAEGLLVYDTDESAFYYYETGSWSQLKGAETRDNFVLVKSEADFPAVSGSAITLEENTYYEINGTIELSAPINLNGAYVSGLDANEDVLSYSGGVVFKGSKGGSIRNVTITGQKAFEIAGTAAETLLVQNTVIVNTTTSVGSISGLGLFFGNIVQFVGNANGITYSDIGNLLLNNQAWLSSNSGTYEKLTGAFSLVQKVSGFSTVNGSAIAFDVSANPTVSNGVLLSTVFSGTSSNPYVSRYTAGSYTGYNFTNNWTVNCPGIPVESDNAATGDINFSFPVGSGAITTFSTTGSSGRTKIQGTTASNNLFRFEKVGENRITYRGKKTRYFQINASVSYQASADLTLILYIAKNGTVLTDTKVYGRGASGFFVSDSGILALPIVGTVQLAPGDYIEIFGERFSGSGSISVVSANLAIK
ncbi:hypothetical protein [Leeuwenhoekiella marinoflava]|uniref:Cell wall anchor protein n=2 Tax=Leeuwenhoekiella marinoflava TaxID=988 RepID=A0A4V1KSG1_9FLAO|nr:hypothetical protein [Leeuwenhoekiella marinoflava]RXG31618.1 hypothetical protein DSL99_1435 [Leeuwenhoekiella marinoflava]SHF10763.1 hypothetical protein SAMN02745246_01746 [Leeuwenhoekiella marinoflava DSM 3653]